MNNHLFERILELSGLDDIEILLEAAKEPAAYIINRINSLEFPNQYKRWLSIKLTKEFKDTLARRDGLNRKELTPYAYEDEKPPAGPELRKYLGNKKETAELFAQMWNSEYQDKALTIRDWVDGSNEGESQSFPDVLRGKKLEQLKFGDAYILSKQWHDSLAGSGVPATTGTDIIEDKEVVKVYPDFYWIDTKSNSCSREEGVGCGTDRKADTIFTLKDRRTKKPTISVSVKYGKFANKWLQAKAAYGNESNVKPKEEHYPYIEDLLKIKNVTKYDGSGSHMPQNDFKPAYVKDPELRKMIDETNRTMNERIKKFLKMDNISQQEGVEFDENEISLKYDADERLIDEIVYSGSDKYSLKEVLTGEANEDERSYYTISDAWDYLENVDNDIRTGKDSKTNYYSSDGYEHDEPIFDIIKRKMEGAVYEYEGEHHIFGDGSEEKLRSYSNYSHGGSKSNSDTDIMKLLLDEFSEPVEMAEVEDKYKNLISRNYMSDENLNRLKKIKDVIEESYWHYGYEYGLDSNDYSTEGIDDDALEQKGLRLDVGNDGITVTVGLDAMVDIISSEEAEDDEEINLKSLVADYFSSNSLSQPIYSYEPDMRSEEGYMSQDIADRLDDDSKFPSLRIPSITDITEPPDHPSQLRFPGMEKESFERMLELAGVLNETK